MEGKFFNLQIDNMIVAENQSFDKINNLTQWTKVFDGVRMVKILIDGKYSFKYKEDLDYPNEIKIYLFNFDIVLRDEDKSKTDDWNKKLNKIKGHKIESTTN